MAWLWQWKLMLVNYLLTKDDKNIQRILICNLENTAKSSLKDYPQNQGESKNVD